MHRQEAAKKIQELRREKPKLTVGMLLERSVEGGKGGLDDGTVLNAPLVQYASGFRSASVYADHVTDLTAQAAGARKAYVQLRTTMPEYFPELPDTQFLPADQIAAAVGTISQGIKLEIGVLKFKVNQYE